MLIQRRGRGRDCRQLPPRGKFFRRFGNLAGAGAGYGVGMGEWMVAFGVSVLFTTEAQRHRDTEIFSFATEYTEFFRGHRGLWY